MTIVLSFCIAVYGNSISIPDRLRIRKVTQLRRLPIIFQNALFSDSFAMSIIANAKTQSMIYIVDHIVYGTLL